MKRFSILSIFIFVSIAVFAQVREDTTVFVGPVVARPDQAAFFKENFDMETRAAGYALADSAGEADYSLRLDVGPNLVLYDDGVEEQAPPDEPQFVLRVTLVRNEDDYEMVAFSYPFTEVEEMYEFNLYLLYQAMANVPLTRLGDIEVVEETDRWRNKWLYIRGSFEYVISNHLLKPNPNPPHPDLRYRIYDPNNINDSLPLNHVFGTGVGATIGAELQFLDWMSAEAHFVFRFGDPVYFGAFIPGIGLQLKYLLKPSTYFMLEPYIMAAAQMDTLSDNEHFPRYAVGGGMQLGVKGGEMGAFFVDANFLYSIGDVVTSNPRAEYNWYPLEIHYNRIAISIGIGYKIGFFDRRQY